MKDHRSASEAACIVHDFEQVAKARSKLRRDALAAKAKADGYKQPGNQK